MSKTKELETLKDFANRPPQAIEVEQAVLGAMLLDQDAIPKVEELLKPEYFYEKKHRIIYEAMQYLSANNSPVDTITLFEELKKTGKLEQAGGAAYVTQLVQDISSAANVEFHAKIVLEKWILRKLISTTLEIASRAYQGTDDVFDLMDKAESTIFNITQESFKESYKSMDKALKEALEYIEAIHAHDISTFSVPSGYSALDELLGGFQKSDLIIVAARPSMGKTAFALSLARNAAVDFKHSIAIFSLEMSTLQLTTRLISAEARIDAHKIRTGRFKATEGSRISRTADKLSNAKIYIDDTPAQTILEIRAKARRLKAEKNIDMVIIDYLQLIDLDRTRSESSREREISIISRSLKALAKELNIPVIALSQLNRAVEQRHDKRPMLSDLRESGSIEQDADVVLLLYRPEAYGITADKDGNPTEGIAEIIVGKQRNGPTDSVKLKFIREYARFENLDLFHDAEPTSNFNVEDEPEDLPI